MANIEKLEEIQNKIARSVDTTPALPLAQIKTVAGFDVVFQNNQAVCAAVVFDLQTRKVVERKSTAARAPLPYIPGFIAFREGPLILQAFYDLETVPDVLLIDGEGISHPQKCGVANYVGTQLAKPTIGVGKLTPEHGTVNDNKIIINGELRGVILQTKTHAKPLLVSPGHLIDMDACIHLVQQLIFPPHKLPEPVHYAHRLAKNMLAKINGGIIEKEDDDPDLEELRLEKEHGVNSGMIV